MYTYEARCPVGSIIYRVKQVLDWKTDAEYPPTIGLIEKLKVIRIEINLDRVDYVCCSWSDYAGDYDGLPSIFTDKHFQEPQWIDGQQVRETGFATDFCGQ